MGRKVKRYQPENRRVSYIRKPFAVRSLFAAVCALLALLLLGVGFRQAVVTAGDIPLNYLVLCLFSFVFALVALVYAIRSFFEKEKDYLFSKISLTLAVLEVLFWILVCFMG
ncbi:MAG: calcium:proton exchanger [bacterium]|nr:calcium:proton exchanger [bacterium]